MTPQPTVATPAAALSPDQALALVDQLQEQLRALETEVGLLHKRDSALNDYMAKIDEEMRLAARLQQDFLPKKLPEVGNVRFHTLFRPAGYVSGDLYDVMRLDETHVGFYIADAVGHGMPAALLTMFMKNALVTKEILSPGYRLLSPSQTMCKLNEVLLEQNLSNATFATAIYGVIDTKALTVSFAKAGHPSPLVLRRGGDVLELEADGGLLGIFPDDTFETRTYQLQPGDRMLVYTDGIEVAFAEDQIVDARKWREALASRHALTAEQLVAGFAAHLDGETGSILPKDDLTLIVADVG
jgi:serine phosphatase RsbU (regulator of sigma subunit)